MICSILVLSGVSNILILRMFFATGTGFIFSGLTVMIFVYASVVQKGTTVKPFILRKRWRLTFFVMNLSVYILIWTGRIVEYINGSPILSLISNIIIVLFILIFLIGYWISVAIIARKLTRFPTSKGKSKILRVSRNKSGIHM